MTKVIDLGNKDLDRMVALCWFGKNFDISKHMGYGGLIFSPSTDWAHAGPIIECEGIRLQRSHTKQWWASPEDDCHRPVLADTPLVAAMRCYVMSVLGPQYEVPNIVAEEG